MYEHPERKGLLQWIAEARKKRILADQRLRVFVTPENKAALQAAILEERDAEAALLSYDMAARIAPE